MQRNLLNNCKATTREREKIPAIDKSKNATRFLHFALNDLKATEGGGK
mgnify:CR=1 FL=1